MLKLAKAALTLAMAASLAGCMDVSLDVALTSPTTATATLTQVMNADFYTLTKMNAAEAERTDAEAAAPGFCAEGKLTENIDGTATCVLVEAGPFAELDLGQGEGGITFSPAADGLVRITISTAAMEAEASIEEALDGETQELIDAFFTGRTLTVSFGGDAVVDTNMTLAEDGKSASQSISLLDLMNGEADLPDELFAVVRTP